MTTYDEAKAQADTLNAIVKVAGDALKTFPKGPMGLTPDAVRATAEWQTAKATYDNAFARLRAFNARFTRIFASDIRAERRARGR